MSKGGKKQQQQKRKQDSSEQQDDELQYDEEDNQEQINYQNQQLSDGEQKLLQKISVQIVNNDQPLKLTWAAIHKLKEEQKILNQKMQAQMKIVQNKYQALKNPLTHKIAKIASGQIVQKQIYTQHELTNNLNINKHKPKPIPEFWKKIFDSFGLFAGEDDSKILQYCTKLQSYFQKNADGDNVQQTIKIVFYFDENPIITNKTLKAIASKKGAKQFVKKQVTTITFKNGHPIADSAFGQHFNLKVSSEDLFTFCQDINQAYQNSVFYYFNELQDKQALDRSDNEQEVEQDQDSQHQSQPGKKANTDNKNFKKPVQKPECKQQ